MKVSPAPKFSPVPTRGWRLSQPDSLNAKAPSTLKINAVSAFGFKTGSRRLRL
jgi:hypothetical protein